MVLEYTYDLRVENHSGASRIVVPTNDGGVGPNSVAYLPPADGESVAAAESRIGALA